MARRRRPLDVKGEAELVLSQLEKEPAGWRRERLLAVKHGLEGELDLEQIAERLGRARASIQIWFNAYRKGGVELLLKKGKGNGPKPQVRGKIADQLREKLAEGQWRTAAEAREWLEKEHGIKMAPNSIYRVLGKCGGRLKVVRPVHRKKDEERAEAFKTQLCQRLKDLNVPAEKPVRIWVQDEMRFGLQSVVRRAWGLRGIRIVKPVQQRYEWGYVYGALEVNGEGAQFSYLPTVSKEATRLHLKQISQSDPDSVHILIWDGAGFHHHDGDEELPANIRLLRLPPYSPELNPIEKLWDIVKDGICNRLYDDLETLEDKITEQIRPYWEDAKRVRSLIGNGWMLREVNAI